MEKKSEMLKENRILIVDDDSNTTHILDRILTLRGFKPTVCFNGLDALNEFRKEPFPIVITDIDMPVMNGIELIENIKAINDESIIIILSGMESSSIIIKTMKLGVYDYIVKPMNVDDVCLKIQHAKEAAILKKTEWVIQREKQIRLELQLEWYRWQERIISRKLDVTDASLFEGVRRSFTQGLGFGTLLSLVDILCSNAVNTADGCSTIDNNLIAIFKENIGFAKQGLNAFSEIENIHKNDFNLSRITVMEMFEKTAAIIHSFDQQSKIKNITFLVSDPKKHFSNRFVDVDEYYMEKMIREVLLNSIKFSPDNSPVTIIIDIINDNFVMHIMNIPVKNDRGIIGIPEEYENIIFEPFIRISKTVNEGLATLDYGIGLTMCDKIAEKLRGSIKLFNINDYSDLAEGPQIKVCCEIQIPLA